MLLNVLRVQIFDPVKDFHFFSYHTSCFHSYHENVFGNAGMLIKIGLCLPFMAITDLVYLHYVYFLCEFWQLLWVQNEPEMSESEMAGGMTGD